MTVSAPARQAITVQYTTVDGTAIAGTDYKAKSGTLTIPAGVTSGLDCQINVPVYEDSALAVDKTFYVVLSNASAGTMPIARSPRPRAPSCPTPAGRGLFRHTSVVDPPAASTARRRIRSVCTPRRLPRSTCANTNQSGLPTRRSPTARRAPAGSPSPATGTATAR